ncbi:MFS transporter [Hydrogenophaga sp.]|uniref:MFS transporter n=1 Tax=Hydrogenophaga sp. TaxID=1904254 RepID=UPI0019CC430A|nr:MFS transporter [Hydrogenophaga sp.]MBD3892832.1 MFS transporter [Hydrogenophaga sp.]
MLDILAHKVYRHLFLAQALALLGTGLATVALSLLAFDLAGADAGAVLGTALAIKMLAYIGVAPIAAALIERLPRRKVLVLLDLVRAALALALPFVTQIWQVYVLIFLLQAASAAFTPAFQATVVNALPDERDYTKALSLSRLAYDLESLLSPMLAALLLTLVSFHSLFGGTALGFLASAALLVSVLLPPASAPTKRGILDRTTRGLRIYLATPRLQGLLALNLAIAAGGAMVIVNTVVLVQSGLGLTQSATAFALASFGAGSMLVALALPSLLERVPERRAMLAGASLTVLGLLAGGLLASSFALLLGLWFVLGMGYSLAQTPAARLLRRSSAEADRPALFAAQFALSHACWLLTYPLAGWLGAQFGQAVVFATLAALAAGAVLLSLRLWPKNDPLEVPHRHDELEPGHPHLGTIAPGQARADEHSHAFVIDDMHPRWPR